MAPRIETVSLTDIMKLFGVSDETIRLWRADGMPHRVVNGHPRFKPAECVAWRRERDREEQRRKDAEGEGIEDAQRRKAQADADLAEIKRDQLRGRLTDNDATLRLIDRICHSVRARVLSVRGRWAPRVVGLPTMAEATKVLDELAADILKALNEGADDLDEPEEEVA